MCEGGEGEGGRERTRTVARIMELSQYPKKKDRKKTRKFRKKYSSNLKWKVASKPISPKTEN